ncbi:MAG: acyloxyacyl hydrolase [Pelagibacterales bacterium]|nr:acyloxyacyl hydrolase [Pelagibacterales bacterium]
MINCVKIFFKIFLLSFFLVSTSKAEGFTYSIGNFDHSDQKKKAAFFQLDYDSDNTLFSSPIGNFKPVIGFLLTEDKAKYGFGGVRLDYKLANNSILISPSFTPGLYGKGDGKDLGHVIEFKTQIRAALNLTSSSNIGVSYSHLSNASLGNKNPGANNYSISFQKNF